MHRYTYACVHAYTCVYVSFAVGMKEREKERERERDRDRERHRYSRAGAKKIEWSRRGKEIVEEEVVGCSVRCTCSALQCVAVYHMCCGVSQCVAGCCIGCTTQGGAWCMHGASAREIRALQRVAACCCRLRSRPTKCLRARERETKRKKASRCRGAALLVADSFHLGIL